MLILFSSCSKKEKEYQRINESATKLKIFGVHAERIYELNAQVLFKDSLLKQNVHFFQTVDDSLNLIQEELISATGGFTEMGEYFNAPAIGHVDDYFYGKTYFRNNSHQFFFQTLNTFLEELNKLDPKSELEGDLDQRFDILLKHYQLKSRELIFKNMAINEAVQFIQGIRSEIALEQTRFVLKACDSNNQ